MQNESPKFLLRPLIGLILGLMLSLFFVALMGESPFFVLQVFYRSVFGTWDDFGLTAFYATSLIFTGLSVSLAYHAGLFNIGAEGQLTVGCLASLGAVGLMNAAGINAGFAGGLVAAATGLLAGALWGFFPGFIKSRFGGHEVISTMMLNFVAAGLTNYLIVGALKNSETQSPETFVIHQEMLFTSWDPLRLWFATSPVNVSLGLALISALLIHYWLFHTLSGLKLRMMGLNLQAAKANGVSIKRYQTLAMTLAGLVSAGVLFNEILGSKGKLVMGFSPDYGFVGIAVAMLARCHPLGVLLSAFLFGGLIKGASDLDFETTYINRDYAKVIQAIVLICVISAQYWEPQKILRKQIKRRLNGF
jgi:ABC-type uncharacterized transport system permease subunit